MIIFSLYVIKKQVKETARAHVSRDDALILVFCLTSVNDNSITYTV